MLLSRRQILSAAAAGSAAAMLAGCKSFEQSFTPVAVVQDKLPVHPKMSRVAASKLLGRIGYGARPGDRTYVQQVGLEAYVDQQLLPSRLAESELLTVRRRPLDDSLPDDFGLLFEQDDHDLINSLGQLTMLQALYSNRGLNERMVEFWSDHFNIYPFKDLRLPQYLVQFNRHVLRPHALGSFRDLLGTCARSAAMLSFLDNDHNRAGRPNENYARELMELHTLGIAGGYKQQDVKAVARCLTGWTYNQKFDPGAFEFNEAAHDRGPKVILGNAIVSSSVGEMEDVLDMLATHPATAKHIATKLLKRFRGDASDEHVSHVASTFLKSTGNIARTVRAVIVDCDITSGPPLMKRPFDYVVSALRATDADTDCNNDVVARVGRMGQPLFQWPRPDGYPDGSQVWANCLNARWQFALDLAAGNLTNTSVNWAELFPTNSLDEVLHALAENLAGSPELKVLETLSKTGVTVQQMMALVLMSPGFQTR